MSGPWEKYQQKPAEMPQGPWNKYQNADSESLDPQTMLESAGNMLTLGHLPHLQAAIEQVLPKPTADIDAQLRAQGFSVPSDDRDYVTSRDANIKRQALDRQANPASATIGDIAGFAGSLALPGGAMIKAAGLPAKLAAGAATGGVMGFAANPGDKEGELNPTQFDERADNARLGAVIGGAIPAAGAVMGPAAQKASGWLKHKANEKAIAATGAMLKDMRKVFKRGQIDSMGRDLLDEGTIPWLATPKRVAGRLEGAIEKKEGELSDVLGTLADHETSGAPGRFVPEEVATKLKQEIREKYSYAPEEEIQQALDTVDSWLGAGKLSGSAEMTGKGLQEAKVQMNRFLKDTDFAKQPASMKKEGILAVRRGFKEGIENKADALAESGIGEAGAVKETNRRLGSLLEAQKAAQDRISRDAANRAIGLTDTISGTTGATIGASVGGPAGGVVGGIAGAGINKLGRTFGRGLQARGSDALASLVAQSPRLAAVMENNPAAYQLLANRMEARMKGQPSFEEAPGVLPPSIQKLIESDPSVIDKIKNRKIQDLARKHLESIGRAPSASDSIKNQPYMSEEQAQQKFIQEN